MSNTPGFCASFAGDLFGGIHDFQNDTLKGALYYSTASLSPLLTTSYSATDEVVGLNYIPGGTQVFGAPKVISGTVAYWNPASDIVWEGLTISDPFNALLIYNASKGNRAIGIWTFSQQVIYLSKLRLQLPPGTPTTALAQIAT